MRDIIRRLEAEGWVHVETKGSHRQFKHPTKLGKVTVNGHPSADVTGWLLHHIFRQAGLSREDE